MDRRLELEYMMIGLRAEISNIAHALTGASNGLSRDNMRAKVNAILLRLDKMDAAQSESLQITGARPAKRDMLQQGGITQEPTDAS